jgi:hypothetical protein
VAIGIVPFGALVANILIGKGVLAQGTPEARQGPARGQMVGGIIGIQWGSKPNASTPVRRARRRGLFGRGAQGDSSSATRAAASFCLSSSSFWSWARRFFFSSASASSSSFARRLS